MGKEAKIGLGVIVILLIVFGVVLARRLSSPSDGSATAETSDNTSQADKSHDDGPGKHGDKMKPGGPGTRPKIVEGKAGSGARSSPADIGSWSVVSDGGTSKRATAATRSAPPSFMPRRPAPDASSPLQNPYQTAQPAAKTAADWQGGSAAAAQLRNPLGQPPAAGDGRLGEHGRDRMHGRYTSPGAFNPTRQADPSAAGMPAAPSPGNPLRGQAGAAAAPGYDAGASRYSGGGYQAPGYGPTAYREAQHSQAGLAAQRAPEYAADSTYRAIPKPPHHRTPASVTAQYGPEDLRRPDGTYVVQPNDNYWLISTKLYGSGGYFKALAEHNRKKYPDEDKLKVGDVIAAPTKAELVQTYADLCPTDKHAEAAKRQATAVSTRGQYATGKTYVVQTGDTLCDIARWELGKPARWTEIYELNRDVLGDDFDHLTPGVKLMMPGDGPADSVTRRNGPYYER